MQVTRRLFDISADLDALDEILSELGGDVSDSEVEEALDSWFATLSHERDVKLDSYAALIKEMGARAEIRKQESNRLRDRARVDENAAQRLKDRLIWFFREHELKRVETARYKLTRATAGGKQSLSITGPIPAEYQRTEVVTSADTDKIREALEAGKKLGFAELKERSEYLRIS